MLSVKKETELVHVLVYPNIMEILIIHANPNVSSTAIVVKWEHVSIRNVLIHVPVFAETMLNATLSITLRAAFVHQDTPEILFRVATNHLKVMFSKKLSCDRDLFNFRNLSIEEYLPPIDLCHPSPCGPYSECKALNGHAVCSCTRGYIGSPPACHPECVVSSDCVQTTACRNQKCVDPCPGTCGLNAECHVVNHSPICSCLPNYVGDPFIRCFKEESKSWNENAQWRKVF